MIVDLTEWDVLLVNSSAGKDSQAMLDYVVELAAAHGVLDRVVVVHADLGRVEWQGTRELAEEHARHYGLRFEVVTRRDRTGHQQDLLQQVEARGKWPSSTARYCTSDHKRSPVLTLMTRLAAEVRSTRPGHRVRILNIMGLRAQESSMRAKKAELSPNERASNGRREVAEWLPILHWDLDMVWNRIAQAGTRHHPAYDLGMPRLSCCFCVLAPKSALVLAAQHNPELAARYVAVEARIGHQFKHTLSMAEVVATAEASPRSSSADDWAA